MRRHEHSVEAQPKNPRGLAPWSVNRTRVSNHNSYPINEKIRLFAEDARGVKYIVDIIYADLEPNQAGNSTSSIPLSKIGTAPHTVVVE